MNVKRTEKILSRLDDFTYATAKQLQITEDLKSNRNARRILHEMEKDRLITHVRYDYKVYYLSNKGMSRIDAKKKLKRSWVTHSLMRNDLYIKLGMPATWEKEKPITWNGNKLIPDAYFIQNNEYHFVEIDNLQSMQNNYDKIDKYRDLFKAIFRKYKHHPTLIWFSNSEIRTQKIKEKTRGMKARFY